jgi:hypothetical protein
MRLLPGHMVLVATGSRVLPLPRAWHELANRARSAPLLHRPV